MIADYCCNLTSSWYSCCTTIYSKSTFSELNREHQQQSWGKNYSTTPHSWKNRASIQDQCPLWDQCKLGKKSIFLKYAQPLAPHPWLPTNSAWMMKLPKLLFREGAQRVFLWIHLSRGLSRRSLQNGSYKEGRAERGLFSRDCRPRTSHGH